MPDITMCRTKSCPKHRKCYRYMAAPNECWQSWGNFKPKPGRKKCIDFIPIGEKTIRNKNNA